MIRAVVTIGVMQFVSMCLLLARTKILAVTLGPGAVGAMSVIDRVTALITQTLSLSLPFAALRYLPAELRKSPVEMDVLYRRMRAVLLALILPATAASVALTVARPAIWGAELVPYRGILLVALAGLPIIGLVPFLVNAFASGLTHERSMAFSVSHSAVFAASALAAGLGLGLRGYYALYALLGTILVAAAMWWLRRPISADARRLTLTELLSLPGPVWRFGGALLALTFAMPYASLFVLATTFTLYGAEVSGILQSAIGLSLMVRTLLGTAHSVLLTPHVNRQETPESRMQWANEFQRTLVTLFVIVLPPLLLFADVALRIFYSGRFVAASSFVGLFVAAEVVTLLSGTYQVLILAGDRVLFHVIQNLVAQVLLAGIAAVALPRLGPAGAGLATLAAPVFLFISTLIFLSASFGLRISREAAIMASLTAGLLVACGAIGSLYPGLGMRLIASKAAVCVGIWGIACLAMPSEDRSRMVDGVLVAVKGVRGFVQGLRSSR